MRTPLKAGDLAPNFTFDSPWRTSRAFLDREERHDAVLVFLRYQGCPICQMEMARLRSGIAAFDARGARVHVVLQSAAETLRPLLQEKDWPFDLVCDPEGTIFRLYRVERGGVTRYLHPVGLLAAIRAIGSGYGHGRCEGKETQLPAVFVVKPDRTIRYAYYGRHIGDVPAPATIAAELG